MSILNANGCAKWRSQYAICRTYIQEPPRTLFSTSQCCVGDTAAASSLNAAATWRRSRSFATG